MPLADAHELYLARTYAYVAAGREGLAIVDIETPEKPTLDQMLRRRRRASTTRTT